VVSINFLSECLRVKQLVLQIQYPSLRRGNLIRHFGAYFLLIISAWVPVAHAQDGVNTQELFAQQRWSDVVNRLSAVSGRSSAEEYEYGIALAQLGQWDQAHAALDRGYRMQPKDKRFPIELAGVAFKQKNNRQAAAYLRRALRLDGRDDYANEFLATVYFLQGNLEAAVKYWNRISHPKPEIAGMRNAPALRTRPALLDHAFAFSSASVLRLDELRKTDVQLNQLEIFPTWRLDLAAQSDGRFDSVFRAQELNGFGNSRVESVVRTLRGLPFQEIRPEYYNIGGSATNLVSLGRWDSEKRRYAAAISGSLWQSPQWRYRIGGDIRNENWDIRNGFTGPAPVLGSLNTLREAGSAEVSRTVGWRWQWSVGAEFSHRDFRNVVAGTVLTPELLQIGFQLKQTATLNYQVLRSPERRLDITSTAGSESGRLWSDLPMSFEKLQGSLQAHWLPKLRGDDYETYWRACAGKTFGQVPFDELFMLGLEHDNDPALWMRAHIGTRNGRKGSAPLGRDYFLSSWESDKNLYRNGLLTLKLGPFVDTGKITDPGTALGSQKWLADTGAEAKLRVLGVGVAFVYGKDLRTGNNAFYVTLVR